MDLADQAAERMGGKQGWAGRERQQDESERKKDGRRETLQH